MACVEGAPTNNRSAHVLWIVAGKWAENEGIRSRAFGASTCPFSGRAGSGGDLLARHLTSRCIHGQCETFARRPHQRKPPSSATVHTKLHTQWPLHEPPPGGKRQVRQMLVAVYQKLYISMVFQSHHSNKLAPTTLHDSNPNADLSSPRRIRWSHPMQAGDSNYSAKNRTEDNRRETGGRMWP
ncbi:hypothetical protein LZ30DRAFT_237507 [Colletotrichum cereale]|nr:hypothetical protein LZ30DRAFT_237507 [Colletotrichum cereale]